MNVALRTLAAVAACTLLVAGMALAGTKRAPSPEANRDLAKAGAVSDSASGVTAAATAISLMRYGDANKDALALITAAQMLRRIAATEAQLPAQTGAQPPKSAESSRSVGALLARARVYAAGDAALLGLADEVAKSRTYGVPGGPVMVRGVIRGKSEVRHTVKFTGGEPARVFVSGDGDSDLDLYVLDANGHVVCEEENEADDMLCGWTPRTTGQFVIRIENLGIANEFMLWTN